MAFMDSLRQWIREHQLSYEQFGALIGGTGRSHVAKLIGLQKKPSLELLWKIHQVTSIPTDQLLAECLGK